MLRMTGYRYAGFMTLWAEHSGKNIKVAATYGAAEFTILEHPAHMRAFWAQLGHLLDEAEKSMLDEAAGKKPPAES